MSGFWQVSNRSLAGAPATASVPSPLSSVYGGQQVRLRALECFVAGSAGGGDELVVRDGPTLTGPVIFSADLSIGTIGGAQIVQLTDLDIRATIGNTLTIEFVSGIGSDRENVNAQGDYVPIGYPLGQI